MIFNSSAFLIFLAVVLVCYRLTTHRMRALFLLLASYFFYGWWD